MSSGLGRLHKVDLRDVWQSESGDFTPWLARDENLALLGETLGLELELEAQERPVGRFRADMLCKDLGTDGWVLIENQLERTDHAHLGQVLTYASGLGAVTIIWIAARFEEEHRSTLDWLNRITDEGLRVFGIEVELWSIGGSPAAPRFNVVCKPNDWSKSVSRAARALDESELSDVRALQLAYWTAFHPVLVERGGPFVRQRKPQPQSWMPYAVGRTGVTVNGAMIRSKRQVRAELYLSGQNAKAFFHLLRAQRREIEAELGRALEWEELPDGLDSRAALYLDDADAHDEADWPRQQNWLADRLAELHRVFAGRVRELDPADWRPASGA